MVRTLPFYQRTYSKMAHHSSFKNARFPLLKVHNDSTDGSCEDLSLGAALT